MTHSAIAKILGLSTEGVRRIEQRAIAKLSHPKNKQVWERIREILSEIEAERAKRDSESEIMG